MGRPVAQRRTSCLLIGASLSYLVNLRGPLIKAMLVKGLTVYAAASGHDPVSEAQLASWGVPYYPLRIARAGMNPLADVVTLLGLFRLMRRLKPDMVLVYNIKPVVYGGLVARLLGVRSVYSLITGLGYAFTSAASAPQWLAGRLARLLYRMSLCYSCRVFFQNPDDARAFVEAGLVAQDRAVVVNGSGVDLESFRFVGTDHAPGPGGAGGAPVRTDGPVRFLLIARLLWDKGIGEYVAAARIVNRKYPCVEFHLIGHFDPNPAALKAHEVHKWHNEGSIRFHGSQSDVRPFLRDCHVFVLPSYREGTPRTILEAMATGRAVITTDAPGCRETVSRRGQWATHGKLKIGDNGILVPVKDVHALAVAMEFFIENPGQIAVMGRAGRLYAEQRYDVHQVNTVMLREMDAAGLTGLRAA